MIKPLSPEILKTKGGYFADFTFKNTRITGSSRTTKNSNFDLIQEKVTLRIYDCLSEESTICSSPEGKITDVNNASVQITGIPD
jgi:hypothetical protein